MKRFKLHHELNPTNYKITNSLSTIDKWEARILIGNSLTHDKKKGDWEGLNYIGIHATNNEIVPIAYSDEHQSGYELLYEVISNPDEYTTISRGHDYVATYWDIKRFNKYLQALANFRSMGGSNIIIELTGNRTGKIDADTFIKHGMDSFQLFSDAERKNSDKKIAFFGEKIIDFFVDLTRIHNIIYEKDQLAKRYDIDVKKYFTTAYQLLELLKRVYLLVTFFESPLVKADIEKFENRIIDAEGKEDWQALTNAIFAFNGIKNTLHQSLKSNLTDKVKPRFNNFEDDVHGDIQEFILQLSKI